MSDHKAHLTLPVESNAITSSKNVSQNCNVTVSQSQVLDRQAQLQQLGPQRRRVPRHHHR